MYAHQYPAIPWFWRWFIIKSRPWTVVHVGRVLFDFGCGWVIRRNFECFLYFHDLFQLIFFIKKKIKCFLTPIFVILFSLIIPEIPLYNQKKKKLFIVLNFWFVMMCERKVFINKWVSILPLLMNFVLCLS